MKLTKKFFIVVVCLGFAFASLNISVLANEGCSGCENTNDDGQSVDEIVESYLNYSKEEYSAVLKAVENSSYFQNNSRKW